MATLAKTYIPAFVIFRDFSPIRRGKVVPNPLPDAINCLSKFEVVESYLNEMAQFFRIVFNGLQVNFDDVLKNPLGYVDLFLLHTLLSKKILKIAMQDL